jgi:hypothetical protein
LNKPFYFRSISALEVGSSAYLAGLQALGYASRVLRLTGVAIQWVLPMTEFDARYEDFLNRCDTLLAQAANGRLSFPKPGYCIVKAGEFYGAFFPLRGEKTVYIRADLGPRKVCSAVAHECKHLSEFGPGGPLPIPVRPEDDAASEARAERFAAEVLAALNIQGS